MRLYEGTVSQFKEDVIYNRIADKLAENFKKYYRKKVSNSEYRSWENSLPKLKEVLELSGLSESNIIVEYELPFSRESRVDVILFGKNNENKDNIVIIELKQWSNNNVSDTEDEGNVVVDYGKHKGRRPHPCQQVEGYYYHIRDNLTIFDEMNPPILNACVYCHNYNKGSEEVLYYPKFEKYYKTYSLFSKQDVEDLGKYLEEKLGSGKGQEVMERFGCSVLKPSKKLLDHTGEMINKQQIFHLLDEQLIAYNTIMSKAKKLAKSKEKSVIIVPGGPGTGKSVIALEVMGELLRSGIDVYHATGSSAFTNTLRNILGARAQSRFKFFYNFSDKKENGVKIIICDEAHRIRKDSNDYRVPAVYKSKNPQIDDIIRPAMLSIFFIDEKQIVRPNEIGNIQLIVDSARKLGVKEENIHVMPELRTQFRCGGSGKYLDWIEKMLQINEKEDIILDEEEKMEFNIVDTPQELKDIIYKKNKEKPNCARIVAGFCWKWSSPRPDGTLVNDVKIGEFEMPWERKSEFWKWATKSEGMDQVGTVYTSQGFEFDYIGVIFGNDLVYNKNTQKWDVIPSNSFDTVVIKNNSKLLEHLKNVYRVLLSRAHKGVYVYFMDKDTEDYFKNNLIEKTQG